MTKEINLVPECAVIPPKEQDIYWNPREHNIPTSIGGNYYVYMNKTPESLVKNEGWFPYYFNVIK